MFRMKDIIPTMITPFTKEGKVDYKDWRKEVGRNED